MTRTRRSFGSIILLVAIWCGGAIFAGCQSQVETTGAIDKIGITTSQLAITVENKAQMTLFNVRVAIVPVGRATEFTTVLGRMDSGQRRDLSLADFRGRDGTPFNLRVHRPRSVVVTAKDMNEAEYQVETGWK